MRGMNKGVVKSGVIEVWEKEGEMSEELVEKVFMGRGEIGGY